MADNEKEGETSSRGTEWEVVSLTASAYAAAPGTEEIAPVDETKDKDFEETDLDTARTMFMSGHFVFPPSEHENLPLEPDSTEILNTSQVLDIDPTTKDFDAPDYTQEENRNIKGLSQADELHGVQFFDKGKRIYVSDTKFEGKKTLQGLNLVEEEQAMYGGPVFSSSHTEIDESILSDESPSDCSDSQIPDKKFKDYGSGHPCETWWKRQAASLYAHAKEANTFWSICVAAALMGLVILGQRWQQERWQIKQLKFQYSMTDEKIRWVVGPITRLKDVLIGVHQRAPVIRSGTTTDH